MSLWTAVKTWASAVVTVADLQTYLSDNTDYLKSQVDLAPRLLSRQNTLQTVVNTVAETTVFTFAVPGGTLGTSKIILLSLIGDVLNNMGSGQTITVRVKYGGTTLFQAAFTNVNPGTNRGFLNLESEIAAANATNAQRAKTVLWLDPVQDAVTAGVAVTKDSVGGGGGGVNAAGGLFSVANHMSLAEDSTASKNLVVTFQMGSANASFDMRAHVVDVQLR